MVLNPNITKSEDLTSAVIEFPKDSFSNFLGEELKKAQDEILEKAAEYVNNITTTGYSEAGRLFAEHDTINTVDLDAPIFGDEDRFQAHIKREEIDLVETQEYVPAVKITQAVTSVDNLRPGLKTMNSVYQEIMKSKESK